GTVDYVEKKYLHIFNDKYFFTPPETFFLQHFPKERDWLLVEKSADDFANLPMFYGEFLLSGFELGEPLNGVLDLKGMDSIQFKIKSPEPIEKLTYEFSYEKEASEIKPDILEEEYTFKIPFISKRRGYLTLFYKRKAIISYKISSY
ncbi:MAG: hypothetical protein HQ541_20435, partial [Mariniphaga sp.]|nr:hypothetical protein [Mariniphaga sp.]